MALLQVLDEEVPYHARIYPMYCPVKGYARGEIVYYREELQSLTDDMIEDLDIDDDPTEYHIGKVPLAKIERAFKDDDKDFIGYEVLLEKILHHRLYNIFVSLTESRISRNNLSIEDLKIMHIWNISLNNKSSSLSWSAKFEDSTNSIKLEIQSRDKNEKETSDTKVVGFLLDTKKCDSVNFAMVDGYEVKYSLFSNAYRVKLEIKSYNDDGSPALNVKGHVRAYFRLGGKKFEKYIFGGQEYKKSAHVGGSDTLVVCPALILPRNLFNFRLDVSLNDEVGNFAFNSDNVLIFLRSIAIDEEFHNVGEKGYIIITASWACFCVDLQHGICTCPGTAIGFGAENVDNGEVTKFESTRVACDPVITCDDDNAEGGMKRMKVG